MANKTTLKLIDECNRLVLLVQEIKPDLKAGKFDAGTLTNIINDLRGTHDQIEESNSKLVGFRKTRGESQRAARQALSALRDGIKADFGADSAEYERAGRTPISKRARNGSAKKTAVASQ